jgi:non-ribosomal peptide synthetase component E (peptide arylation enzyme)
MLTCEHCESPQFLQITSSKTQTLDEDVLEIKETIECTFCELEGTAEYDLRANTVDVSGGIVHTTTRPVTATNDSRLVTDGGEPIDGTHAIRENAPAAAYIFMHVLVVLVAALPALAVMRP